MPSCLTSINTFSLSRTDFETFDSRVFRVWSWFLTFRGHPRSKIFSPFESPYTTSYLTPIDTFSLSRTVFEIFDFEVFRVWPLPLTFRGDPRSKICSPFQSPYMPSYLTSIGTFSLSLVPFSKYSTSKFLGFDLDLGPLGITRGRKYFHHLKAHIWLPIQLPLTLSLYLVPFSRYSTSKFLGFDFDLWGHPRSKICSPFESPYTTCYLTSIDTFSLSRTVFEIFGYRGLEDIIRVYLPFSSMTSYINIFAFRRFCTLQGFRKYKNKVSSPSNSIVIESERFYRASADSNPPLPVQV